MFVEVSPELAAERGLEHMGWCHVVTARSAVEGRVMVTDRLTPLRVEGRVLHQVWLPYHFGVRRPGHRRLGQRPVRHHPRPQRADPGEQGRHLRRPARPPAHRARRCWSYVADYRARAGSRHDDYRADRHHADRSPARRAAAIRTSDVERSRGRVIGKQQPLRPAGPGAATPATTTRPRGRGSSPTPASASAARRARWPARSGTASRTTASTCSGCPTTTPAR